MGRRLADTSWASFEAHLPGLVKLPNPASFIISGPFHISVCKCGPHTAASPSLKRLRVEATPRPRFRLFSMATSKMREQKQNA
jgi:hypothetical protein